MVHIQHYISFSCTVQWSNIYIISEVITSDK